jgi:hypothetical protein
MEYWSNGIMGTNEIPTSSLSDLSPVFQVSSIPSIQPFSNKKPES